MKRLLLSGLLLAALALHSTRLHSQVTIGSGQAPTTGTLLDLKERADGTSDKGLGMPRVIMATAKPAVGGLAASIGGTGNWNEAGHTGLMVYNTKDAVFNPATCETEGVPIGLYVWNGSQWQSPNFKDPNLVVPGEGSIVAGKLIDREGNDYHIATYGAAGTWMTENLRTKTAPGAVDITESAAVSATDMYYAYPQPNAVYVPGQPVTWTTQHGLCYNWVAAMNRQTCASVDQGHGQPTAQTDTIQGICPFGWHVPSDREWNELEAVFAASTTQYASPAATAFAWQASYNTASAWRPNALNVLGHGKTMKSPTSVNGNATNGTSKPANSGGFDVLLAGHLTGGDAVNYGITQYFWSSSARTANHTWFRNLDRGYAGVTRGMSLRTHLYSVRCKKN